MGAHGMHTAIPIIKATGYANAFCIRRPHGKANTADVFLDFPLRAQGFVGLQQATLAKQIQFILSQAATKGVRIMSFVCGIADSDFKQAGQT